jgi:hypothetical protein
LIAAGLAVVQVDRVAGISPVPKMALAVRAGPCTPRGLNPVALPAPAGGPVSAHQGLVLVLVLDLAHPGPAPAAQVV